MFINNFITNFTGDYNILPFYGENKILTYDEWLYLQKYINVFCSRFSYENLPEKTQEIVGYNSMIELLMFFSPALAWFEDSALGLQCLPIKGNWQFNIVGTPTEWEVFGFNGYSKKLNENNSVIMPNDSVFSIPYLHTLLNVRMISEIENTHRQNLKRQRQPLIMEIDEDEKKSAKRFADRLNNFADVINIRIRERDIDNKKSLDKQKMPFNSYAYDSNIEFIGDKLVTDYTVYENRIFQYYGYNNLNIEKKERLLVDEINAGNEITNAYYDTSSKSREKAIEKVNKMFNVKIELKENKKEFIKNVESIIQRPDDTENSN